MIDTNIFEDKTAAYYTLGCKLNFAETSTIGKELAARGIRKARPGEQADFCIINTCSVTELADKKCRQMIRRISRLNPSAYMIVTGCYAQLKAEDVSQIEGVNLIVGAEEKLHIAKYIEEIIASGKNPKNRILTSPIKNIRTFAPSCSADDRTRHFLKVQDGCDYFCTYCTIPFARGKSRNGSIADVVRQAETVAAEGGKEIVITGVNIGDFGKSTHERFIDLLRALDHVEGIQRYRISSIEPDLISDEIIAFVAESRRFMPHFHIPLQSGSDTVLKLMHRHYDTRLFQAKVEQIKSLMPSAFIGIDVIVGSRGETDELFAESRTFIESLPFSQLHVFNYSERPNTQALKITYVVPPAERQARSKMLLDLSEKKLAQFYENHIGTEACVLFEHARKGRYMYGFTENYIKTEIPFDKKLSNQIRRIVLNGWNRDKTALQATLID